MKTLDIRQLEGAMPVQAQMTRREKLRHWAQLVRRCNDDLLLYSNLEHMGREWLAGNPMNHERTAFGLAARDATLQAQGLRLDSSLADGMQFFELSQSQLHEFSCDCGGHISNLHMADRIEKLAG